MFLKRNADRRGGASSKAPSVCTRAVPPTPAATNNLEDREKREKERALLSADFTVCPGKGGDHP